MLNFQIGKIDNPCSFTEIMRECPKPYLWVPAIIILFGFFWGHLSAETFAEEKNRQSPNILKEFNFVAAGDFDCGDEPKRTVSSMMKTNPEIVIALGDLSYRGSARCWLDTIAPLEKNAEIKITFGSHDMGGNLTKYNDYLNHFNMTQPYYSFNYQDVHFLAMATAKNKVIPFSETSKQYEFVINDLKKANENKRINWIMVYTFRPLYSSNTTHPGLDELRDVYHRLFDKYGVDIVLQAHNHNYQRTYPLKYNQDKPSTPIIADKETANYSNAKGPLFIIVGTGGRDLHNFTGQAPYVITQFQKHGFLNIDINSSEKEYSLSGTFYENRNMGKEDYFSISKKKKGDSFQPFILNNSK